MDLSPATRPLNPKLGDEKLPFQTAAKGRSSIMCARIQQPGHRRGDDLVVLITVAADTIDSYICNLYGTQHDIPAFSFGTE